MKYVIKQAEPESFINWKNSGNEDWQPNYANLQTPQKEIVVNSLLLEQGYICCYCERDLKDGDYHIEHFKPKDVRKFPHLQLEYNNLLCSCQVNIKKGDPLHCGNSKENWYEDDLISPLDPDCEKRFKYTEIGQILPFNGNDAGTKMTIEKLNLDIDKIKDLRKNTIEPFLNYDDNGNEIMTKEELSMFIEVYLKGKDDNEGKYNEFYTTIKYLFSNQIIS